MASGTTNFDNTLGIDYIVGYTGANVVNISATTIDATTVNATTLTGASAGTTLTAAGTFAPTFASGYVLINAAAGTDLAFVLDTSGLAVGGEYRFMNHTAPTAGTYTLTTTAGTFYAQGTAGTVAQFAGADYSFSALVIAANTFQVIANVGTVTFA
jgi:hypothetical protein